jgi:hypothetical protein
LKRELKYRGDTLPMFHHDTSHSVERSADEAGLATGAPFYGYNDSIRYPRVLFVEKEREICTEDRRWIDDAADVAHLSLILFARISWRSYGTYG